jgi:LuxR family maltose regulon positive regulatory protein
MDEIVATDDNSQEACDDSSGRTVAEPILRTKLNAPHLRSDFLVRQRLLDWLEHEVERPLTLVSAPAGYGKSILVAQWLANSELPGGWFSLDKEDNDLRTFLRYFIEAIRCHYPAGCSSTHELLDVADLPEPRILGSLLANELEVLTRPFIMVLDDYHCISNPQVHAVLGRLLEHPSGSLHLAIVTRRDPPFRIAAMRAVGMAVEIRESDLRFNQQETWALFDKHTPVIPQPEILAGIALQLEGWVAGLQMVLLCMPHHENPSRYLAELHGCVPDIREYLLQQVLSSQPLQIRTCLLITSMFERFCAPLVDALLASSGVAGNPDVGDIAIDGADFVRYLEERQLFVVSLDAAGRWVRYHHFFQQNLQDLLHEQRSEDEIAALYRCASEWFEKEGLVGEAIQYALLASDEERAAEIIERNRHEEFDHDRWLVVQKWLDSLSIDTRQQHVGLLLAEAWIAFVNHQGERLVRLLQRIEATVEIKSIKPNWRAELGLYQGCLDYMAGQGEAALLHFEEAHALLQRRQGIFHGELELWFGIALGMVGKTPGAVVRLTERLSAARIPDGIYASRLHSGLFFVRYLAGDLIQAGNDARDVTAIAKKSEIPHTRYWANFMEGCTHLQSNRLDRAIQKFSGAIQRPEVLTAQVSADATVGLALSYQLLGDADAANGALDDLLQLVRSRDPSLVPIADSCRARLGLLRGDSDWAIQWAQSYVGMPAAVELSIWIEVPVLTQARVLLADGAGKHLDRAVELLESVRRQAEHWHFVPQMIEVQVLQALALERLGKQQESLDTLYSALSLAGPGGWIRPFIESAEAVSRLMAELPPGKASGRFMRGVSDLLGTGRRHPHQRLAAQAMVEPFTRREVDVLNLLARRLYDKEIAQRLNISPSTVRTHLKHIYEKLQVQERRQAVRKAKELGLL